MPWRYVSSLPERRGNYIFYAGCINHHKGSYVLLRAFKLLREWEIDVGLIMTDTAGIWVEALARRYGGWLGFSRSYLSGYFRLMAGAGCPACGLRLWVW
jgi:glycosyltransferase involved in cell wall biosynthesis